MNSSEDFPSISMSNGNISPTTELGTGLYVTNSRNESIKSYESSMNSAITKTSYNSSIQNKVKNIINRKRSQSLNYGTTNLNDSQSNLSPSTSSVISTSGSKFKLMRNKSLASILPPNLPSLVTSSSSTRDNSISSLSDFEMEFPALSPLTRIEENSVEQTGVFAKYPLDPQITTQEQQKIQRIKDLSRNGNLSETDITLYDNIADNILKKVSVSEHKTDSFDWNI